jgi:hypothetical protein
MIERRDKTPERVENENDDDDEDDCFGHTAML